MKKEKTKKIVMILSLIVIVAMSFSRIFLDDLYHGGGTFEDGMGRPFEVEGCAMPIIEFLMIIPFAIIILVVTIKSHDTDYKGYWIFALMFLAVKIFMIFDTGSESPCPVNDHGLLRLIDFTEMIPIIAVVIISLVRKNNY